jgi:gliding motility-associated protein GldM
MAGGKETPRQKMIGMMYLVLTAMLALNVSATVLDAFVLVDSGLSQTTRSFVIKNERLYTQMGNAYTVNPTKVEPWKKSTDQIKEKTKALLDFVQGLKVLAVVASEKEESPALLADNQVDASKISAKGDKNVSGMVFIGGAEGGGKAFELKDRIKEYREFMVGLIDPSVGDQLIQSINNILNTDDPHSEETSTDTHHTWESTRFDHIPLIAVFPQLTKIQLDVLNVEAEVVGYLLQQVDAADFKVNKLDAVVIPKSNYIFQGNEFSAEIFLAASDTTQVPKIYIGSYQSYTTEKGAKDYKMVGASQEIPVVNGKGQFTQRPNRLGLVKWSGLLEITAPDGSKFRRPFDHEFEVAQPSLVVAASKMNVFYRAVDNPMDVSIAGISNDKISVTVDGGGSIKRAGEGFIVIPGKGNTCNVTVVAEVDGQKRNMGTKEFRVRDVPDPSAAVRGITDKRVDKNELAASLAVEARMPIGFDFDLSFSITGFTVMATVGGFTRTEQSNNQMITENQRKLFEGLKSGQTVNIIDIKAVGPDGRIRELNDIVYRIR